MSKPILADTIDNPDKDSPFNRGSPGFRNLTVEAVRDALMQSSGIRSAAATILGCSRETLYKFLRAYPEAIREADEDARNRLVDMAELNVVRAVQNGDMKTSRWVLATMGRSRGYGGRSDRNVLPGAGGALEMPDPTVVDQMTVLTDADIEALHDISQRIRFAGQLEGSSGESGEN